MPESRARPQVALPAPTQASAVASPTPGPAWLPRVEDLALAGWVALAVPVLGQGRGADPFTAGRPLDGLLGVAGILGAAVCVAARPPDDGRGEGPSGTALVGPFVGGLLFVAVSTAAALGLSSGEALALGAAIVLLAVVARSRLPPPGAGARRALVAPYVLVAGGLFSTLVDGVTADGRLPAAIRAALPAGGSDVLPIVAFLVAFSAVCYATLVMAPRRIADPEGGALTWIVRFALFVASIAVGSGWPALLGW